jgi:hypothetical protein
MHQTVWTALVADLLLDPPRRTIFHEDEAARTPKSPHSPQAQLASSKGFRSHTWPWLEAISRTEGRAIDLGTVPDRYWMRLPILDSPAFG